MEMDWIRQKVKGIIAEVTSLDVQEIPDDASFTDDLQLDSLALLEVAVDVDYAFQLGVEEERFRSLRTVEDTVALVLERLNEKTVTAQVA